MRILLWLCIIALSLVALAALWMTVQYRRYRKFVPSPPYKQPAQHPDLSVLPDDSLSVCWIGHSTLYIRWNGVGILTDPVFSERVGVNIGPWAIGPRRHTAPAVRIEEVMGQVDLILLSHAHMDHFDIPSLRKLASPDVEVVTAPATSRLIRRMRFGRVSELGGTNSVETSCGVKVTSVPVRHWGARFPWNQQYGWTGFLLEYQGKRLFYAGDTAYVPTFTALRERGQIDVVCMPIGAYAPDSFQQSHCTPEQAWSMFVDTGGRFLVPIHWDTFVLSQEPVDEPMKRLLAAAGDDADKIVIRSHGEVFTLKTADETLAQS